VPIMMSPTATIRMVSAGASAARAPAGAVTKADAGLCAGADPGAQRLNRTMRPPSKEWGLSAGRAVWFKLALPLGSKRVCCGVED